MLVLATQRCARATCPPAAAATNRPRVAMAHKYGLGWRTYNIQQTQPEVLAQQHPSRDTSTAGAAASAGPGAQGTAHWQFGSRGAVVRCRAQDAGSGFVDAPDADPSNPSGTAEATAAGAMQSTEGITGSLEELLLAYEGQGSGASGATQPPPAAMQPSGGSTSGGGGAHAQRMEAAERERLSAVWYPRMPTGTDPAAAHNAAHCEPQPGSWREQRGGAVEDAPAGGTQTGAAPVAAAAAGGAAGGVGGGAGRSSASRHAESLPADDPGHIKRAVDEETVHHNQ